MCSVPAVFVAVSVQLVRDVAACLIDHIVIIIITITTTTPTPTTTITTIHGLVLDRPGLIVCSEDFEEVVFAHLHYN
jgi:hypothetical protein